MDGVDIGNFGGADDAVDAQVAFAAGGLADADGFVGHLDVHGIGVHLRIDRDRADVQLLAGADDADGDFAAIGNQNFSNMLIVNLSSAGRNAEQGLAKFDGFGVFDEDMRDDPWFITFRFDQADAEQGWPNSTGLAFSTRIWVTTPLTSALISFITFMASIMQNDRFRGSLRSQPPRN
jgi:hypothetical protein